jgi:micrococcal nuclease
LALKHIKNWSVFLTIGIAATLLALTIFGGAWKTNEDRNPIATVLIAPSATAAPAQQPTIFSAALAGPTPISCDLARVTHVVDGDTIDVTLRNTRFRIRYIGINSPESVDPRRPVEYFGKEASTANKEMVAGREVCLERDISETDTHGRLLRYVWRDGWMVNGALVSQGYAYAHTYPPDIRHDRWLRQLQIEAQASGRGLWAKPAGQ